MKHEAWRGVLIGAMACLLAVGCVPQDELDDPTAATEGEELWDEGPPGGEEHSPAEDEAWEDEEEIPADGDLQTVEQGLTTLSTFQLPFPCGQVWSGQTRTNHSPQLAVDFNRTNDLGATVVAAAGGTVTLVRNEGNTSYGRWIEIDHGNGYRTRYAHLYSQDVRVGQRVSRGQRIGRVGNTGGSSGAHLHYELRRYGSTIRPVFNGSTAYFYGSRNYTSRNSCTSSGSTGGSSTSTVRGTVRTNGVSLNVRSGPGTGYSVVGSVSNGQTVQIRCQKRGQSVTGTYGTTNLWDHIGNGYVSDAYIYTGSDGQVAPTCP